MSGSIGLARADRACTHCAKTKISKRVREEAARICSARACDWARWGDGPQPDDYGMPMYSTDERAMDLARAAFRETREACFCHDWAEAEALLRTGWTP